MFSAGISDDEVVFYYALTTVLSVGPSCVVDDYAGSGVGGWYLAQKGQSLHNARS